MLLWLGWLNNSDGWCGRCRMGSKSFHNKSTHRDDDETFIRWGVKLRKNFNAILNDCRVILYYIFSIRVARALRRELICMLKPLLRRNACSENIRHQQTHNLKFHCCQYSFLTPAIYALFLSLFNVFVFEDWNKEKRKSISCFL